MGVLNWVYGVRSLANDKPVKLAMYIANQYRNRLVHIELDRRKEYYALVERYVEILPRSAGTLNRWARYQRSYQYADEVIAWARDKIQRARAKQGTKNPTGCERFRLAIRRRQAYQEKLKALAKRLQETVKKMPGWEADLKAISELNADQKAELSAEFSSDLYYGTRGLVDLETKSFGSGPPPRVRPFEGEGQLAVPFDKGGLSTLDFEEPNTLCYLTRTGPDRAKCRFRIGSDDSGNGEYVEFEIKMHRPLPPGMVKKAILERRLVADHVNWRLRLCIDVGASESEEAINRRVAKEKRKAKKEKRDFDPDFLDKRGVGLVDPEVLPAKLYTVDTDRWVAIHVGWLKDGDGIRTAIWQGYDGCKGQFYLSADHMADYDYLDRLDSQMDLRFNEAIDRLTKFFDKDLCWKPDWLSELRSGWRKWKSHKRLVDLVLRWRDERFAGDQEIFSSLNYWRKRWRANNQNWARLSARVAHRRDIEYRRELCRLAADYHVVLYSRFEVAKLAENTKPEDLEWDDAQVHRRAKQAAPGRLGELIAEKFPERTVSVTATNLTRQCSECGKVNPAAHRSKRRVTCLRCRSTWDIDVNAIANTIDRGMVMLQQGELLNLEQQKQDKLQKRKDLQRRMQEARREKAKKRKQSPD